MGYNSPMVEPSISIVIPTLNAAGTLESCLRSIVFQDYPRAKIELIIADGGSNDRTLVIAKQFGTKIYPNTLKTGEAGKAVGVRQAKNDAIAFIDSDNILPTKTWLRRMTEPLTNPEVVGSEPWKYTWRRSDGFITRYSALLGMNDPLVLFLGNYDRLSTLTGKWTELPLKQTDKGNWIEVILQGSSVPTIGANGTILRRSIFDKDALTKDYLFDIDILAQIARHKPIKFAKVKVGIVHIFCGSSISTFIRKQQRRVRDYLYYQKLGIRSYPWQQQNKLGLLKFGLACVTIVPLFYQAIKGYFKKPDVAWFFHPLACWLTLIIYVWGRIQGIFKTEQMARLSWRQI